MKIIITESQLNRIIKENVDDILDKIGRVGYDKLKSSEKRKLSHYQKHLEKGGTERNFVYSDQPEEDEFSGKSFKTTIEGKPLTFQFSEKSETENGETEYYGKIFYGETEYIGGIFVDQNGYLIDYDFYEPEDPTGNRLQYIFDREMYKLDNFFQNEVIPSLS